MLAPTPAQAADGARSGVTTLFYDTSHAAEFADAVDQGAANWNSRVVNVHLRRWHTGDPHNIAVYADAGWPRSDPGPLGTGVVYMGRQAVREGHDPVRIAAHELGHILGLPDRRTGLCSDLMAGGTAGPDCHNAYPSRLEARTVDRAFR